MGLDIYFYKTKTKVAPHLRVTENINIFRLERDEMKKNEMFPKEVLDKIADLVADASIKARNEIKEILSQYCDYDWLLDGIITQQDLQKIVDYIIGSCLSKEDMYYRKVNLLYAFFADKLTEEDQRCVVTKEEVETIISHCKKVLDNHSLASSLLPTQSGFFFGSTEYSEWYFKDVEDVLNQFTKYLEGWDDDTIGWVYFSW